MPVIPTVQRQRSRRSWFKASLGKKLVRPISINKPGMMVHICNPSYMGGIHRRIVV
jgi:hypothetical protein